MRSEYDRVLPKMKAREIISSLHIINPSEISIEDIAWVRGVLVREEHLEGAEGRLVRREQRGILSVKKDIPEIGRKRFIVAHELGHFELHEELNQLSLCTDRDMLYWYKNKPEENDANMFAAELLMPEDLFKPKCQMSDPSLEFIEKLAEEFQTTLTATAIRYIEFSPYRCAIVVLQDRMIKWYRASDDFNYHLSVSTKLDPNSYATDFFDKKQIPNELHTVLASAWITGKNLNSMSMIKEQSRALLRYNAVITLLWIDNDIDGDDSIDEEE